MPQIANHRWHLYESTACFVCVPPQDGPGGGGRCEGCGAQVPLKKVRKVWGDNLPQPIGLAIDTIVWGLVA